MKYVFIFITAFALQLYLPWYTIALVPLIFCAAVSDKPANDFGYSMLAIFCLWLSVSLFKDIVNHSILSARIAELFHLGSSYILLLLSALVAGLVAGLGGLCGNYFRTLWGVRL